VNLQPKLMRALEDRRVRRIGGIRELDIRCRIIAATNRDLKQAAADGTFREDLYYRLNVVRLELPPLRERDGDIEQLAEYFVDQLCREYRVGRKRLTEDAVDLLRSYDWPGNVRELKNAIESALVLADGSHIRSEHIRIKPRAPRAAVSQTSASGSMFIEITPVGLSLEDAERQLIEATLVLANGNQSRAARMLGISRSTLFRKCQRYRLAEGMHEGDA
jgi:DNA-binding NtrC family response regulator